MQTVNYINTYRVVNKILDLGFKGSGKLALLLAKLIIPKAKGMLIVQTLNDFKLRIDPSTDKSIEYSLYLTGTYEKGTLHLIQQLLKEGDVFVDAGANIGLMTILAAKKVGDSGKVFAFEAHPKTKLLLDENIALNNLTNVITSQVALGSIQSKGKIYENRFGNRGTATLLKTNSIEEGFEVSIVRLDEYDGIVHPQLLKVDVEGFEMEVLKGFDSVLRSEFAPMLIVECSNERENYQSTKEQLYEYIKGINSYQVFKLVKGKRSISKLVEITTIAELPDHDNIFCFLPHQFKNYQEKGIPY